MKGNDNYGRMSESNTPLIVEIFIMTIVVLIICPINYIIDKLSKKR